MTACFARQPFPEGRTAREAIKNGHRLTDGRVERNTKQKELIHDALKANDEFISAQDLHRKLEDEGVKVGLATVYRQLNALAEADNNLNLVCYYPTALPQNTSFG